MKLEQKASAKKSENLLGMQRGRYMFIVEIQVGRHVGAMLLNDEGEVPSRITSLSTWRSVSLPYPNQDNDM